MNLYTEITFLGETITTGSVVSIPFGTGSKDATVHSIVGVPNNERDEVFVCYYYGDSTKFTAIKQDNIVSAKSRYIFDDLATFYKIRHGGMPTGVLFVSSSIE